MTPSSFPTIPSRSMGIKLIAVGIMALIMTIPAWFVDNLVEDRSHRAADVSKSVGSQLGGPQTFLGPVLAVPYTVPDLVALQGIRQGVHVIFPATGDADVATKSEIRKLSLFKVPVYRATINFKAGFDLPAAATNLPQGAQLNWSEAEFITAASDSRGALADATLTVQGITKSMVLSGLSNRLSQSPPDHLALKVFGLRAGDTVRPGAKVDVAVTMRFSGSQRLSVLPFGRTTSITMNGDWPHPGFNGGFLPVTQSVTPTGFQARWSIPFIARGMDSEGEYSLIPGLIPIAPSVAFVELADAYQSVTRSVKYALLFLSLVFAAFFVFESTTGKCVHPAQYFLVGVAQLIFYLLLLSIAERIGFGPAFAIASAATISLISIDASWIFESRLQGLRACVVFSVVYGLIYLLLTLEDQALLIGSIASFLAVAAIMYFTRSIDWYAQKASARQAS